MKFEFVSVMFLSKLPYKDILNIITHAEKIKTRQIKNPFLDKLKIPLLGARSNVRNASKGGGCKQSVTTPYFCITNCQKRDIGRRGATLRYVTFERPFS